MNLHTKAKSAFTLIELIIVIAIIAILAAAIFVAIDPARRLHESRNAVRSSDVATILESVKKYQVDNNGDLPGQLDPDATTPLANGEFALLGAGIDNTACRDESADYTTAAAICSAADSPGAGATGDDCIDLSSLLTSNYLNTTPSDPLSGTDDYTQYYIARDANGSLTVGSCDEEGEGAGGSGTAPSIELVR